MGSQYPLDQHRKSFRDSLSIAHVFNTHFVSLRSLIIYEVIDLRRFSTNCGFGQIARKTLFWRNGKLPFSRYLVYYGYLVLCLSWYIFAWSEWKNLERQQRIRSNKLRFTSLQCAKFKTVHVIEFRPSPLAVHFRLFDEYSSPFPFIRKPFIRKCCIYIILLVMLVSWSRWLKDWKEWRIMQIG